MRPTRPLLVGLLVLLVPAAFAQDRPAPPVRYTEAQSHEVRRTVVLPGTVETRQTSMVASEVQGYVIALEVDPGDRVRKGHALARLRPVSLNLQLRAAQGRLKEAQARLELAENNLTRADELRREKIVSQESRDDAFSEFTAWQGRLDATEAEIALLEVALDRCVIKAPFDGVIVSKRTEVGQWLPLGGEVLEMVALSRIQIRVDVPERYFPLLAKGGSVEVSFESIAGLEVQGSIRAIIPQAEPQARTFPVKVSLPNPDGRIGVGMLARVALPVGANYSATIVPKDAIVRQGPQEMIYRINGEEKVEPVPVQSGQAVGAWIVVSGPVAPGERFVTRGNERLQPDQAVSAQPQEYPQP